VPPVDARVVADIEAAFAALTGESPSAIPALIIDSSGDLIRGPRG
jgi:hypothetical protein